MEITKLELQSENIVQDNIEKLKQLFPEIVTEGKIDFYKLKEALGEEIEDNDEKYEFTWKGKHDAIRESQKTSHGTLRPCIKESKNWDSTKNLYIEGDNLEVLKLLQKSYQGKIKLIFIDPPYNTGKKDSFVYNDDYTDNLKNYLNIQNNDSSNPESSGRFHTKWLNMMYPRLKLARNLLSEDGTIFITLDDTEIANLRKICDEIFGEQNFIRNVIWEKKYSPANDSKVISDNHDHILVYSKNISEWKMGLLPRTADMNKRYINIDNDSRGPWKPGGLSAKTYNEKYDYPVKTPSGKIVYPPKGSCWQVNKERLQELIEDNRIYFGKNNDSKPQIKQFLSEVKQGLVPRSIWKHEEVGHNQVSRKEITDLFGDFVFTTPKPTKLLKQIIRIGNLEDNEIILDFFGGSSTTADATMQYNYENGTNFKYIITQIPEINTNNKSEFKTICEIGEERIRRAGDKLLEEHLDSEVDIGFKVLKLDTSNFKEWNPSDSPLEEYLENSVINVKDDRSELDLVYEIMIKYGIDLTSKIEEIKKSKYTFYSIGYGALIVCLDDKVDEDVTDEIIEIINENIEIVDKNNKHKNRVVFKDISFLDDSVKTNIIQVLENNNIEDFITY